MPWLDDFLQIGLPVRGFPQTGLLVAGFYSPQNIVGWLDGRMICSTCVRVTVYLFFPISHPRFDFHLFGVYAGLCNYLTVCIVVASSEVCAAVFALPSMYDYDFMSPPWQVMLWRCGESQDCRNSWRDLTSKNARPLINTDRPIDPMLWRSMVEWNAASPLTGAPEHSVFDDLWHVMSVVLMVLRASSCHRFWIVWYCDTCFMRRPMPNLTQPIYGAPIVSRETRNEATGLSGQFQWHLPKLVAPRPFAKSFQRFWSCPTKMEVCAKSCWPMA